MPTEATQYTRNVIARALSIGGLVCFAVLALLSGTDRQSREFPSSPSVRGWPYDTGAAKAKAIQRFVESGPGSAIPFARRAIISDPISIEAISMLGRSQLYAGQLQQAREAFIVAGQLGWRDPMTQIYWLDQSIQAGDFRAAAERLDALLRQTPADENRDRFLAYLTATPEGREALAQRLKLSPNWARPYLTEVSDIPAEQVAQRIDVLRRTGRGVWDCPSTITITQRLIDAKQFEEAQSVWRINCGAPSTLVYDGEFDQVDTTRQAAAFDWQLSNRGDVDLAVIQTADGNRVLRVQNEADVSIRFVRQLIVLKPGRYRLSWQTPQTSRDNAHKVTVALSCSGDLRDARTGTAEGGKPDQYAIDITIGTQCGAQQLGFWIAPNSETFLDNVKLLALQ